MGGVHFSSTAPVGRRNARAKYQVSDPLGPPSTRQVPWADAIRQRWAHLYTSPTGAQVVANLTAGLAPTTSTNYSSYLNMFLRFCAQSGVEAFPATIDTVLLYIGWLTERGTLAEENMQPYLSCINTWHEQLGVEGPAKGPVVQQARRGMAHRQSLAEGYHRDQRVPLPARVVKAVETKAVLDLDCLSDQRLRDVTLVLLSFVWFCRSDTGHAAHVEDVGLTVDHLYIRERQAKGRRHQRERRVLRIPVSAVPGVVAVFRAFMTRRATWAPNLPASRRHMLWLLPSDGRWLASSVGDCLQRVLQWVGESPPPSFVWTSHSLRSGPATAANAINVVKTKICYIGGWSQLSQAVHAYIDETEQPTPEAYYYFGWLLNADLASSAIAAEPPAAIPAATA